MTDVPETAVEATYDASNRLTSLTIAGQPYSVTYDANGNLTKKAGTATANAADITSYTWDARNMLTAIINPYVYVENAPTMKIDPLGLCPVGSYYDAGSDSCRSNSTPPSSWYAGMS